MATGSAPSRFMTSAPVPDERRGRLARSASDLTGLAHMTTAGGQVKAVSTLTDLNSSGLKVARRSASTRLARAASGKKWGRSTASETGKRPGW